MVLLDENIYNEQCRNKNAMDNNARFDPKKCYIISQVAHIIGKKDHHEILSETYA
jgi:hypothetical protein